MAGGILMEINMELYITGFDRLLLLTLFCLGYGKHDLEKPGLGNLSQLQELHLLFGKLPVCSGIKSFRDLQRGAFRDLNIGSEGKGCVIIRSMEGQRACCKLHFVFILCAHRAHF